ncbi:hypothetical protein EVG20_g11379 [Dentipellis fragilis]|uniref:Uncharacterized protein n=1 Tax=Dentipellis fragilis TaxID=205917 RepID=A0A4Y9XKG2_9AGAM|nr:hypothetical protein EVG20_g11379 [Dentipellis fragilis]
MATMATSIAADAVERSISHTLLDGNRLGGADEISEPERYTFDNCDDHYSLMIALARAFDQIGIPYVIWGRMCLIFHGVPSCIEDISFVFPDDEVHKAHEVLAGRPDCFVQCFCHTDRSQIAAWESTGNERHRYHYASSRTVAVPEMHHIFRGCINIELWKQSDVLPGAGLSADSPDIVYASPRREEYCVEKGRNRGYMEAVSVTDGYCLRYLAIPAMCEQSLLITARDWHTDCPYWFWYAGYAVDYIEDDRTRPSRDRVLGDMLRRMQAREADFFIVEELHVQLFPCVLDHTII